jgi:hypothetical protein
MTLGGAQWSAVVHNACQLQSHPSLHSAAMGQLVAVFDHVDGAICTACPAVLFVFHIPLLGFLMSHWTPSPKDIGVKMK